MKFIVIIPLVPQFDITAYNYFSRLSYSVYCLCMYSGYNLVT